MMQFRNILVFAATLSLIIPHPAGGQDDIVSYGAPPSVSGYFVTTGPAGEKYKMEYVGLVPGSGDRVDTPIGPGVVLRSMRVLGKGQSLQGSMLITSGSVTAMNGDNIVVDGIRLTIGHNTILCDADGKEARLQDLTPGKNSVVVTSQPGSTEAVTVRVGLAQYLMSDEQAFSDSYECRSAISSAKSSSDRLWWKFWQ